MRPKQLLKDNTLYWVLNTYNPATGILADADSTPTVAVRKNGASVGDSVTVTKRSATTGIYDCSYDPASEVEGDQFTLTETVVMSSVTYVYPWQFSVLAAERGTDSAPTAVQVRQEMDSNSVGLAAIYTRQGAPTGASQSADIAAVKADTAALLSRITSTLFSGITYMSRWLGALAGKTADSTTLAEITATTAGAGYDNTTDSLQAIKDAGGGGDATAANQELILAALESTSVSVTGYASLSPTGALLLKEGHTATVTFTSSTSNIVSDLTSARVYLSVREVSGTKMMQVQGTVLVATGLQSVRFVIDAANALKLRKGKHLFDVVAVYGYDEELTPP